MPLHVETIRLYDPPVNGVAILFPGRTDPYFGVPFADAEILSSFVLGEKRVLLTGKLRDKQKSFILLSVFDADVMAFQELRRIRTDADHFELSGDRKRLFIYGYGLVVVDLTTFDVISNSNQVHVRGGHTRLANARDFSEIIGGQLIFHSPLLEREFMDPALRKIGLVVKAIKDLGGTRLRVLLDHGSPGPRPKMVVDVEFTAGTASICDFADAPDAYDAMAKEVLASQPPPPPPRSAPAPALRAAFQAYAVSLSDTPITVFDWNAEACRAALRSQTKMLATQFKALLKGNPGIQLSLRFRYLVATKTVEEAHFFQRLVDLALPVTHELRALVLAYLNKIGPQDQQIYFSGEGIPALSFAMRALAILDGASIDVMQRFMAALDMDHQSYCWEHVVGAYSSHHGWRDRAAIKVGITLLMLDSVFCEHQQHIARDLGAAAESIMKVEVFASIAEEQAISLEKLYDTDEFDQGIRLAWLAKRLDLRNAYQASVYSELLQRNPSIADRLGSK